MANGQACDGRSKSGRPAALLPYAALFVVGCCCRFGGRLCGAFGSALFDATFLEAGRLTGQTAHVIQLRTADFGTAQYFDLFDARAAQQKGTFHANVVCDTPYREVFVLAAVTQPDDHALEDLDTFAVAFDNSNVNAHRIARMQRRELAHGRIHRLDQFYVVRHFNPAFWLNVRTDYIRPGACRQWLTFESSVSPAAPAKGHICA